ncbi:MAG: acyl-CoA dehydrogenase family protein, partial [Alphaproteobacteria bacterium]
MSVLNVETPDWMTEDIDIFRDAAVRFFERELLPHNEKWIEQGFVDPWAWRKAGEAGILCASMPEEYGGAGGNFAHEAMIIEAQAITG